MRGFQNDTEQVPENTRRSAAQKIAHLELMLGQIANFCPIISRNTIVKNATSVNHIWQTIRQHFGFQMTGGHFLDFSNIRLEPGERPEDLYQRLTSFVEDNLMRPDVPISHHGEVPEEEEELTPTLENLIVLIWLQLLHSDLPALVKQRYGTELRSRTLASIKPEISQALGSLMDEIQASHDSRVLRTAFTRRQNKPQDNRRAGRAGRPSCPLCKQAGRSPVDHYLSTCRHLPEEDRLYMSKRIRAVNMDHATVEDSATEESEGELVEEADLGRTLPQNGVTTTRRVSTLKSAQIKAFYKHHPVQLTIDSGAEVSMITTSFAKHIGAPIKRTSQRALQADGRTPLTSVGEVDLLLQREDCYLRLDALVVNDLDVDVLVGMPFMERNDIGIRPSRNLVTIGDSLSIQYEPSGFPPERTHIRRAQCHILRSEPSPTIVWPGAFLELNIPRELHPESSLAMEPRIDGNIPTNWPTPNLVEAVGGKVRLINDTNEPQFIPKNKHLCQLYLTTDVNINSPPEPSKNLTESKKTRKASVTLYSAAVKLDPDNILPAQEQKKFQDILTTHDNVFNPKYGGYNGAAGKFEAHINMGPVLPPQRKGRLPQYSREKIELLQQKCDELEELGVLKKPEEVGITVEYLNPSFLVKKPNGGYRLVTAFEDVGRYSKPQPSLMPDTESVLRSIGKWKYIIVSDLTSAFHQIHLSRASLRYCGIATPFRGVRVYTRCAMGMPGSETALEELMCRVLGDCLQDGIVVKLADDLYCGGNTVDDLLENWGRILRALETSGLHLSATKTTICPRTTTILGWTWTEGKISASRHRVSTLSSCKIPDTVFGLRSFLGAYKFLGRVIPRCSDVLAPLEDSIAAMQSKDKIQWTDELRHYFSVAQTQLLKNKAILLPVPDDELWIVTDGSVSQRGLGATLYVSRKGNLHLAGFFSAKLRKHHIKWLPCEIEALGIATAIKYFSPYIIQSKLQTHILTDSKPCVQAFEKLRRGEFSSSPRVATFLSIASRYRTSIQHLAGTANIPSDFASRNSPDCNEPQCQICQFIRQTEDSVVRSLCVQDVLEGKVNLPFTSRSAWLAIQADCPDLRRTCAQLKQGTRPSKKLTSIKEVKRYLSAATIAKDGLLVVRHQDPFQPTAECIIIPQSVLDGFLTSLHISLDHPTQHQLLQVVKRHFYALNLTKAIERISEMCHTCASLKKFPDQLTHQSSEDPTEAFGRSFAADVLKRNRQLILILRESVTSYTKTRLIPDEKGNTLREAILTMILELHPHDGPPTVIRVDPAPGFIALRNDGMLRRFRISLDIGRVKNRNKNPVAEKAVGELEEELLRQDPNETSVSELSLTIATARLNSRIRFTGLSARELWTQRSQFTNEQLPMSDWEIIKKKQSLRESNHSPSALSKWKSGYQPPEQQLQVGDLVYLYCDRDKLKARSRYIIVSIEGEWCSIKKFAGKQIRASSYRVKKTECYRVPYDIQPPKTFNPSESCEEELEEHQPSNNIPISPLLSTPPHSDHGVNELTPLTNTGHTSEIADEQPPSDIQTMPPLTQNNPRYPVRDRRAPKYLQDYNLT